MRTALVVLRRPRFIPTALLLATAVVLIAGCPNSRPRPVRPGAPGPAAVVPPPELPEQPTIRYRIDAWFDPTTHLLRARALCDIPRPDGAPPMLDWTLHAALDVQSCAVDARTLLLRIDRGAAREGSRGHARRGRPLPGDHRS
ncbi:MAG: hypothetical protein HYY93_08945 [Planctomycetes bacterium]|nr:hypothetical protein [Planctomycetota bacterium]